MGHIVGKAQKTTNAFTIVELLIVIVVIGILAAIVIVGYSAVINNANDASIKADLVKFGDVINLKTLDNQVIPPGGATSSGGGDSTQFPGVQVQPTYSAYDIKINTTNLYYCNGYIGNTNEFAFVAKSKSGKIFAYQSQKGVSELTGAFTWDSIGICGKVGFVAPFTWSYGYYSDPGYQWYSWTYNGSQTKNLVLNPKGVGSTAGWFVPIVGTVTVTPNVSWNGRTNWYQYVWNGTGASTVRLNLNLSDLTNGATYTSSILVGNNGSSTVTFTMDWSDNNVTTFSVAPNEMKRVYFSSSRSTYDSTYRFLDFNLTSSASTGLLITDAMVTAGTDQYLYRDGSSPGWTWNGTAYASTSSGAGQK